jgi:uncharacterized protein (TIGR03083 family)
MNNDDLDLDLLAAYAADAVDDDEALAVDAMLATSADMARDEARYRRAAVELAAAVVAHVPPAQAVRDRVLREALTSRPGSPTHAAPARELLRIEAERFATLLMSLTPYEWDAAVDPPEFAGWTVRDVAAHVAASQGLAAQLLGNPVATIPETDNGNESRTALVRDRHRGLTDREVIGEIVAASMAVFSVLDDFDAATLDEREIAWWGVPMYLSTICVTRAFELWTHADDIRRALDRPQLAPPAPSLATMSRRAAEWTGLLMLLAGHDLAPMRGVLDLTGPGGGTTTIELGLEPAPSHEAPVLSLRMDVVEYCRLLGRRTRADGPRYEAEGDRGLAADLVAALPSLAQL